jgi:uncharacterized membrane protein YhaH (DUF805 family)
MESPFYWMTQPLKKYADFSGRARRMEYWMFVVLNIGVSIVASILDRILGMGGMIGGMYGLLQLVAMLALLVPGLAVAVRRLHDQDRSGWWLLIALIPILGGLALLVFMFLDGTPGDNRFGSSPKGASGGQQSI